MKTADRLGHEHLDLADVASPGEGDGPPRGTDRSTRPARRWREAWHWYRERLWPTVVLFAVLAVTATLTNSAGRYIGDNRFEQYFNPARRIAKSLSIWDSSRGLGRVREDFWPGTTLPMAVFRSLGASPILTEHLWHAFAIVVAAIGMVQVMRLFRPRLGIEHLLAGGVMAFGAFSASYLTPFSNLYFQYALAPWFIWVFYRGLHSQHPWRWAAGFSLLVLAPGNVDTPGLLYNLAPLLAVSFYVVFVERAIRLRHWAGFVARAGPLALLVNAAVVVKIYQGAATYGQRLNDTEAADISFRASSWTESFRGLGNWLSYYRDAGQLLKPQGALYFSNWAVVVCTFVPPLVALGVMWLSRWRPRILFGLMALTSLVVLVGAYPLNEPSPLGSQVYRAFSNITFFFAFRNTYKGGAGLVMGVAALFGVGVAALARRLWRRSRDRGFAVVPALAALVALVVTAFPFWSNNLYNPTQQSGDIPSYWTDALHHLDEQSGDARVLILPQTSRTRYRWGWVGDDIFDALLTRPHAVATGVPLSTPLAANLLEAVSNEAANPAYKAGTLAPILRRLGISRVVLRNDLDWRSLNRPRPAAYEALRADPDFRREAVFGAPGENTGEPDDSSSYADLEKHLPPVEVWELKAPVADLVRVEPDQPSLLVSGDGEAWGPLAAAGALDGAGPVEYTGSADGARLREQLDSGSSVAITDTNRRRLRVLLSYEPDYSQTLSDGQQLDRPTQSLFPGSGTQSVAWFPDASGIALSGSPRPVGGSQPWYRAANAFDGDNGTSWLVKRNDAGRTFTIDLRQPTEVSQATFTIANVDRNDEGITRGRLRFSDGSEEVISLGVGALNRALGIRTVPVSFTPRTTTSITFTPTDVEGDKATVGLADVRFDGVDLREFIQVPDDVFSAAAADPELNARLGRAPLSYTFTRSTGEGPLAEETAIRRRFRATANRSYSLQGQVRLTNTVADAAIDRLIGGQVSAYGSERADGDPRRWGGFATDGDARTSWEPPAKTGETLLMRFPKQTVTNVALSSLVDTGYTPIKRVQIAVGDQVKSVDLATQQPCPVAPAAKACRIASVEVPPTETDHLEIRITDLESGPSAKSRIDEVVVNGKRNAGIGAKSQLDSCHDVGIRVTDAKGDWRSVPVKLTGSLDDLLSGRTVGFVACDPVRLDTGWHLLDGGGGAAIDSIRLVAAGGVPAPKASPRPPALTIEPLSPTRVRVTGEAPTGAILVLEQSFAKSWVAKVNGQPGQPATPLDTLNGWRVADSGQVDIELVYGGQFTYGVALLLTGLGVALCVVLLLHRPRGRLPARDGPEWGDRRVGNLGPEPGEREVSMLALVATSALAALVAYLLSGFGFAVVLAAVAVAVLIYRADPGRPAAMGAFVLLLLAAVGTIVEVTPSSSDPNLTYAVARPITSLLGTLAGALTATAVALFAVTERSLDPARPWFSQQDRRAGWRARQEALPRFVNRWAPAGVAVLLAVALTYLLAPPALSAAYDGVVRSLRAGAAYSLAGPTGAPTGMIPPLAPSVVAFGPFGGRVLLSMLAAAAVLAVTAITNRRAGYRAALGAAFTAALLPTTWGVQLGVALAGVGVLGAVALAEPSRLSLRRAILAGVCCGLAGLARPDALVVVPVLVLWLIWSRSTDRRAVVLGSGGLIGATLAVLVPWLNFVRANFASWWPADSLSHALTDPNAGDRLGGLVGWAFAGATILVAALLLARRRVSASFVRDWFPYLFLPLVSVALAVAFPAGRDALGWSGLLAAVVVGYGVAPLLFRSRRQRPPRPAPPSVDAPV